MGHLLIYKGHKVSAIVILFIFTLNLGVEAEKNRVVVDTEGNETQRISILVGRAGAPETLADGDPPDYGDENPEGGGEQPVKSTAFEGCRDSRCCYQFTWQGYVDAETVPSPANATCEYLKKERQDDGMACFDPIVYTEKVSGRGNPPNITELQRRAELNEWNIYCPLTQDKSCITLKYFSRGGGKQVVNETRFCGAITETNSGSRLTSGCFSQKVSGYVRQVCACDDKTLCNNSSRMGTQLLPVLALAMGIATMWNIWNWVTFS